MLCFSLFNPLIIIKIDQMKFSKSLLFNFIFMIVFHESLISHEDILHYGNVKTVVPLRVCLGIGGEYPKISISSVLYFKTSSVGCFLYSR